MRILSPLTTTVPGILILLFAGIALGEDTIVLWPNGAPGATGTEDTDKPTLTVFLAPHETANGTAVVICPGGAYHHLSMVKEGEDVARWLNSLGVSAFVLKYRLAPYRHPNPMLDAQRALRTVRSRASEWHINPAKVGVLGFSAGGHLASTVATHFDEGDEKATDPIDKASCRPDFAILCYPVISFADEPIVHKGGRANLLGPDPTAEAINSLSNEQQVTSKTPPVFLWHTTEDKGVVPQNSVQFYLACLKAGVPAELHIYAKGPHGIGLAKSYPGASQWVVQCEVWMRERELLKESK